MTKKNTKFMFVKSSLMVVGLGGALVVLPGCSDWFKKFFGGTTNQVKETQGIKEESQAGQVIKERSLESLEREIISEINEDKTTPEAQGPALLSINGKAVLHENDFKQNVNQMLAGNPYFRGASIEALPKQVLRKLFDELTKQKVIVADAEQKGLDKKEEFKKAYAEMASVLRDSLMVQFFEKDIYENVQVDDKEVIKYFNENKEERFVKKDEEITSSGVKFSSEEDANKFFEEAKQKDISEFEALAKAQSEATYTAFGPVSKRAKGFNDVVPAPVRETLFALKKLPGVEKVKAGKDFWVITASDKKPAEFFALDDVKTQVAGMLKNNKFKDAIEQHLKEIKGGMKVIVNEDYFKEQEATPQSPEASLQKKSVETKNTSVSSAA